MDRRTFLSALALLLTGCVPKASELSIGSKNFTEQLVLGELLAQSLGRSTTLPVDKRFYLAGSYICHQALLAGRIDMYVEYTGTALVAILKEPPSSDHASVFNTVKQLYSQRFGLEVLPSLGFDNTFAMVMRGNDARRLRLKTLSDAAAVSPQLRMRVWRVVMTSRSIVHARRRNASWAARVNPYFSDTLSAKQPMSC